MIIAANDTTLWDTDLLLELAGRRLNVLEQLYALGRRQIELISTGDMTLLIQVLAAKHNVLAELQQTEKRLDPFRDQRPEARRWRDEASRLRCAEIVDQADRLFREILDQEKRAETELARHRDETAKRLQMTHTAGHARAAYAAPIAPAGMLDLHTEN